MHVHKILTIFDVSVFYFGGRTQVLSERDAGTVRKQLYESGSVPDTTEEGESLLSLACSAGYYELAQVFFDFA